MHIANPNTHASCVPLSLDTDLTLAQHLKTAGLASSLLPGGTGLAAVCGDNDATAVAVALAEPISEFGGSSLATWTYGLQLINIVQEPPTGEEVVEALYYECIARFLNAGSRVRQLRGRASDRQFLAARGLIDCTSSSSSTASANSEWSLAGDRAAMQGAVQEALESRPASAALLSIAARLLHDAGDIAGAVDAYLRAVQADPARGEVFRSLGGAYQSLGQHQMAFAALQQAISIDPQDYTAYLKLGMLYEDLATTAGEMLASS